MIELMDAELAVAGAMGAFGSVVHAFNECRAVKKRGEEIVIWDVFAIGTTALFASMVFSIMALMMETGDILHLYLASATGGLLGMAGLTRVTNLLISLLKGK